MRYYSLSLYTLLFLAASSLFSLPPAIHVPSEVRGDIGDFITVRADTEGKIVRWVTLDKGLSLFPTELLKDPRFAIVIAKAPGQYRLLAYTAASDEPSEPAICLVIIAGDPTPPGPNPPPGPGPTPPPVPDAFLTALNDAWNHETAPDRISLKKQLAALYRQTAVLLDNGQQSIPTWGSLFDIMKQAAKDLGIDGRLQEVQKVIQVELNKNFSSRRDESLTPASKKIASALFIKIADTLDKVN